MYTKKHGTRDERTYEGIASLAQLYVDNGSGAPVASSRIELKTVEVA